MKILIVSDTHGRRGNLNAVFEREGKVDMLLHLGDAEGDEDYIAEYAKCPVHILSGNNDFFSGLPGEKEIQIGKYHVFMTHGHNYYVSVNTGRLREAAQARGADIVLFGHTHQPYVDVESDLKIINPGSLAYPRQEGRRATYVVMEIDTNGRADFELKFV